MKRRIFGRKHRHTLSQRLTRIKNKLHKLISGNFLVFYQF